MTRLFSFLFRQSTLHFKLKFNVKYSILFLFLFAALQLHVLSQQVSTCPNSDFALGNFSNWIGRTGSFTNCCPNMGIVNGRHTLMNAPATDPRTGNNLNVLPPGMTRSAKLGNEQVGAQAESLTYTISVTDQNALFLYKYAVVLEDPSHSPSEQPKFIIRVLNASNQLIDPVCGFYQVVAAGSIPGFQNHGANRWKNWTTVAIDLTPYIGQTVRIEYTTYDCSQSGHFGYAYLSASCMESMEIQVKYCEGDLDATLTAPEGFLSYLWTPGGETTRSITITDPIPGTSYSCYLQSHVPGCDVTLYANLEEVIFIADAGDGATICKGDSAMLNPLVGSIFEWTPSIGLSNPNIPNPYASPLTTTTYTLEVTDVNGCISSDTVTIHVLNLPDLSASNSGHYCEGDVIELFASGGIAYEWSGPNGFTSTLQNPVIQNAELIYAGYYSVTVTGDNGCSDTASTTVVVYPNPIPIASNTGPYCIGNTIEIGADIGISFNWAGPQNWSSVDQNPSVAFATLENTGTYTVTVTDMYGCTATASTQVNVHPLPSSDFTVLDVCFGDDMDFQNTSDIPSGETIIEYIWNFGDNSPFSNVENPTYNYTQQGSYTVTLISISSIGCTDTISKIVNVFDPPEASFTLHNACMSDVVYFTNTSSTPIHGNTGGVIWDFGDGSGLNTTDSNPNHIYNSAGTYTVTLIATNGNLGCADTTQMQVEIYPLPISDFSFENVCLYQEIEFSNLSQGTIVSFDWDFGDNNTSSEEHPAHIYAAPGTYNVSLITQTDYGCLDTVTYQVETYSLPDVNFSNTSPCDGIAVQFEDITGIVAPDNISQWQWYFDPSGISNNSQHPSYLFPSEGTFEVQLIVTTSYGCVDSISKMITVHPNPVVEFSANQSGCSVFCPTFADESTITTGSIVNWKWKFGNNDESTLQHPSNCFSNGGRNPVSFDVELLVISNQNCSTTLLKPNYITVLPNPIAYFSYFPTDPTVLESVVQFNDMSIDAISWYWGFGDGIYSFEQHPAHHYQDTGLFNVELIVENIYGCLDTSGTRIYIKPEWAIFIPNAFSPNQDGINDIFFAKGYGIREFEMIIYNRWGNIIFNSKNIDEGWNGRMQGTGEICKQDVYIYKIVFLTDNNKLIMKNGNVLLMY